MSFWKGSIDDDSLGAAWQELAAQAKERPWLLKLLAERGAALATRYALWKARLQRLRLGERRRLQRRLGVGLAGAALLLALTGGPAGANPTNTITVDGSCTLVDAINAANTDTATGSCGAGSGADTIDLQVDVSLTAVDNTTYGNSGLPVINTPITIEGNGHTISRSGSASVDFRVMAVGSGGNLSLNSATISGGVATPRSSGTCGNGFGYCGYGGGIYAGRYSTTALGVSAQSGAVDTMPSATITNSMISGNQADYGGGVYAGGAWLVIDHSTVSGNSAAIAGGGLYAWKGATTSMFYSTFSGNTAVYTGGGVQNGYYSFMYMVRGVVSGNSAATGAGIFNASSSLAVGFSTIADNSFNGTTTVQASSTFGHGAALRVSRASGDAEARRVRRGQGAGQAAQGAVSPAYYYNFLGVGGGLLNYRGFTILYANEVTGNSMPNGAGIANLESGYSAGMIVAFSTISGNSAQVAAPPLQSSGSSPAAPAAAGGVGGGMVQYAAAALVVQSTLTGNSAAYGGGMANFNAYAYLINSTFSGNSAAFAGGGMANRYAYAHLDYNTFVGNTAANGGGIYSYGGTTNIVASTIASPLHEGAPRFTLGDSAKALFEGKDSGRLAEALERITTDLAAHLAESRVSGQSAPGRATEITTILHGNLISGNTATGGHMSAAGGLIRPQPLAGRGNELDFENNAYYGGGYNVLGHDGEDRDAAFYGFSLDASDFDATIDGNSVALSVIVSTTLADNDSPVLVGAPPGTVVQTLALPTGSPAVDFVPTDWCDGSGPFFSEDQDERTKPRNVNGDGAPSDNECDAGAFELQVATVAPRIIVHKQTLPNYDPTEFQFKLRGPVGRDFSLADDEPHSTGQIPAGIYTLEEIMPSGWDPAIPFDQITCDDGSPLSAIDLGSDEVLVCRFLNYKRGNIIVKKATIPPVAAPSFAMRLIDNTSLAKTQFSLANGGQFDTGAITSVPTYKLLEPAATLPGGWKKKIIACDNGSPATAIVVPPGGSVTCTVTNENSAPTNILLSNVWVAENKPVGTVVGTLTASDAIAGDTHTFAFVNDGTSGASGNGSFKIVGNQLQTNAVFDYETKTSYNIKLKVTDTAGQTKVKNFVIQILDKPG
ncbi:MAG: cadherin repeat domain-containing protein [Caldilineales bacterium]|nr:cadherin repeat domain-containing protein [Caldilineales bacterium]